LARSFEIERIARARAPLDFPRPHQTCGCCEASLQIDHSTYGRGLKDFMNEVRKNYGQSLRPKGVTRVSSKDLHKMKDLTDWKRVDAMTEEDIERAAASDPAAPMTTAAD
jgi:hypothetical protein